MIHKIIFMMSIFFLLSACAEEKPKSTKENLQRLLYDMGQDYQTHTLDHARERDQNPGTNLKPPTDFDQYQKERQKVIK